MRKSSDLDLAQFKVMFSFHSLWVISYSTSIDHNIVSVTIFEIFDV